MTAADKGFVYLIQHGDVYKIGMTIDMNQRLTTFGFKPEVIHIIPSDAPLDLERSLHMQFRESKVKKKGKCEWFVLSPGDVEYIKSCFPGCELSDACRDCAGVMEQTTIKVSKDAVEFMKSEGRYGDSLASICDRLFEELKTLRTKKARN